MDIHYNMCYAVEHETPRKPSTARRAKASCNRPAAVRQNVSVSGRNSKRLLEFRRALGTELPERWQGRTSPQVGARTTSTLDTGTETKTIEPPGARADRCWLLNGSLDIAPDRPIDRKTFSNMLPPRPHLEDDEKYGVDMAEAGTPRHPERREDDRPLEEARLAAYKKKPQELGLILHSSMKADFSSSRTFAKHGGRSERPRFSATATNGTGFPLSPPSQYPRNGVGLGCTSVSIPLTSPGWRSFGSCVIFCDRYRVRSFSSGMVAPSTGVSSSRSFCSDTDGFTCTDCRLTHRRSIPMSSYGLRQSMRFPMVHLKTSRILALNSGRRFIALETPNGCSGPAFMPRICRGHDQYIHYLCETQ